jgi:hypothetical protein
VLVVIAIAVLLAGLLSFTLWRVKRAAELQMCGNHAESITLAARLWANDHDGKFPANFIEMSNEVATPKILVCPGNRVSKRVSEWSLVTPENIGFEIVAPGIAETETNQIYLRCKVHSTRALVGGAVFVEGKPHHKF